MRRCSRVTLCAAAAVLFLAAAPGGAQTLRYSNHREVQIPDYAFIRVGPFYSSMEFSQSAGYRYSRSRGTGTDYLVDNRLGAITSDGSEFPLVSIFTMRNCLLISRRTDLDLSVSATYAYYPLDTQDSGWQVFFPDEGVSVGLSSEFMLTPFVRGTLFDNMMYRTDFVDTRGLNDYYGGEKYVYFHNSGGLNLDWLMAKDQNLGLSFVRDDMLPRDDAFEDQKKTSYSESALYQYELFQGLVLGAGASFVQDRYATTGRVDVSRQDYYLNLGFSRDLAGGFRVTRATTGLIGLGYARAAGASRSGTTGEDGQASTSANTVQSQAMSAEVRLDTEVCKFVNQTITFRKGLRSGFEASIENYEDWRYQLAWQREQSSAAIWTSLSGVELQGGLAGRYDNWGSGVNCAAEVIRGVTFVASSTYTDRINRDVAAQGPRPESAVEYARWLQSTVDYATWTSTAGVRLPVTKCIGFSAEYAHIERISDVSDLAYIRDVVGATLTYSVQF